MFLLEQHNFVIGFSLIYSGGFFLSGHARVREKKILKPTRVKQAIDGDEICMLGCVLLSMKRMGPKFSAVAECCSDSSR